MPRSSRATALLCICIASAAAQAATPQVKDAAKPDDGAVLRAQARQAYPSLLYVDRYRARFPDEAQGATPFWSADAPTPAIAQSDDLVRALAGLEDQHVALIGPKAGKTETLGALFRTSTDGSMIAWRVFDASAKNAGIAVGDQVLAIDGMPTGAWLHRASALTFGGNRRGRYAEAALDVGLGTPIVHRTAQLGSDVNLLVQAANGSVRTVGLHYQPMDEQRATAMATAIDQPDLPEVIDAHGTRVGTLRFGAFAPQYDPVFVKASDLESGKPGATDDQAMLAGYCAVVGAFVERFDAVARKSDVVVIDLRGNLGGFDRLARLETDAIVATPTPPTFDLFASGKQGKLRLAVEQRDPSCGHATQQRPIVVLDDAGTRSGGEFMAAWLWSSGAIVVGESTAGAGGGFEFNGGAGIDLPASGLRVRISGDFTVFDPKAQLADGDVAEEAIVAQVAADGFAPSHDRPFAIQSVGLRPDMPTATTLADLRDGGVAELDTAIAKLRDQHRLSPGHAAAEAH